MFQGIIYLLGATLINFIGCTVLGVIWLAYSLRNAVTPDEAGDDGGLDMDFVAHGFIIPRVHRHTGWLMVGLTVVAAEISFSGFTPLLDIGAGLVAFFIGGSALLFLLTIFYAWMRPDVPEAPKRAFGARTRFPLGHPLYFEPLDGPQDAARPK